MAIIASYIYRIINRLRYEYEKYISHQQFSKVKKEGFLCIGPELMSGFELRHPENIEIGKMTAISGNCFINARGGVKIGAYCHIAKGLTIYSHNHNWRSEEFIPYDHNDVMRPVIIGNCVWIGCNVTIAPGTTIGDGVIVSSGSVVFGNVEKCAIVRGNPATVIGHRDIAIFDQLFNEEKFM